MTSGITHTTALILSLISTPALAENAFTLSSPAIEASGTLPADLKCTRDGGTGLSPPLQWTNAPEETQGFAVIMHHYPRGTVAGTDAPSQYWLLWNIPSDTTGLAPGNPTSVGDEGSDKDGNHTGYTPPCSPPGATHESTITAFALSAPLETLPSHDDGAVDWEQMTNAMNGLILASSALTFTN